MDPNNNQPINTNPLGQPVTPQPEAPQPAVPQPAVPQPTISTPPPAPIAQPAEPNVNQNAPMPPKSSKKILILLLILVLLIVGMAGYVFFVKNQLNVKQKAASENTSVSLPTATPIPTPATIDQVEVASPEADLSEIETDVQGL